MTLSDRELEELRAARAMLEKPSFIARVSNTMGAPVEQTLKVLPGPLARRVGELTESVVRSAFDSALYTLRDPRPEASWDRAHKLAAMGSGALGGAFGLAALALELPVSTGIMLRSIADIARSEGEDLRAPETKVQCIQVLALGGPSAGDDAAEAGYFAARAGLAKAVTDAAKYLAAHQVGAQGAPAIVRLLSLVASRFSVVVSQKAAAQSVPLVGAFGGATINALFIDHYQDMARGHFTVRRLERKHGAEAVRAAYAAL